MGTALESQTACARCGGLMAVEQFTDVREGIAQGTFVGGRCLNCGHIEDPVITGNRGAAGAGSYAHQAGRSRQPKGPACMVMSRAACEG